MGYLSVPSPHELVRERASAGILVPVLQLHAPDGDIIHQQSVTRARAPRNLVVSPESPKRGGPQVLSLFFVSEQRNQMESIFPPLK